ncbi:receptor-like protein kinase 7 [Impatiens glandulifera]|uniref:receptor-like protein kinase 7 n=1 Tax=Impatiens glandulifera TaxID=253017 RepID=UPI001FB0516F|nr:receptor-like protein kinase 7 [Impatiens glandulifera]
MKKHHFCCLLSLLVFSSALSDELESILAIKSALNNPSATIFNTWNPTTNKLCNFSGITCHPNGAVQIIELSQQYLSGKVPFDSICKLKSLERLSLGSNFLVGSVTADLRNCVNLNYLDLRDNLLNGVVPDLSPLKKLVTLYLELNGFSGPFPWYSLANMSGLVVLSVGDNTFDKSPFPEVLTSLKNLELLYLSNCSIVGSIPRGIGNLRKLHTLELADNYLEGKIPSEITKLRNLKMLELYDNLLTGELPVGLGRLSKLEYFDASNNQLHGDLSEIKGLTNMVDLQLYSNGFTGQIPPELGDFRRLVNVSFYQNKLTGEIPQKLGYWSEFYFIDVSENNLTGSIPPDMCRNGNMSQFLVVQNKLTGGIPATYTNCTSLYRLRVSNNSLSGEIPSGIWGLPKLGLFDISLNEFHGPISEEIGKAASLEGLRVNNNRLSGQIPVSIRNASKLVEMDLNNNQISGRIPETIGYMKKLSILHLQNNKISGSIPETINSCVSLSDINMANNSISGDIPFSFGSLPALNSINLSRNQLVGPIPTTLFSLKLTLLDLSHNHLSGPIPDSFTTNAYSGSFDGNEGLCSRKKIGFQPCSLGMGIPNSPRRQILILLLTVLVFVLLLSITSYLYIRKKRIQKDRNLPLKEESWNVESFDILTFNKDEILNAIKLENQIGQGGSGNVYKVSLSNGMNLAVKCILNSRPEKPKQQSVSLFDAEVRTLSSIRHINVVKLYCSISSEHSRLLVYEFMPNGSLWDQLHSCPKMTLDWETRFEIAIGAAKGLEYLHHGCNRPIIHRDVKSSNILLDEALKPRISDFGLAKIVQIANQNQNDSTQIVAGTHGYIAPEYGYTCKVSEKSDVYSFGVVLMELVTGKKPIEPEFGVNKDIVEWICGKVKTRESALSVVDFTIQGDYREESLKVLRIAIDCIASRPSSRPTMKSVVQMLELSRCCKMLPL